MVRRLRVLLVVVLVASATLPASASAGASSASAAATTTQGTETLPVTVTVQPTDDPRTVRLVYEYDIPLGVEIFLDVPPGRAANVSVVDTSGLEPARDSEYRYRGDGQTATLTVDLRLSRDRTDPAPIAVARDGYAFFRAPRFFAAWLGADAVAPRHDVTLDARGYASFPLVYLGNYTLATRETDRQTLHAVVPAAAPAEADGNATLRALDNASRYVPDDDPPGTVTGFLLPAAIEVDNGGMALSARTYWVTGASADPTYATWIHEYVHTSQDHFGPKMQWFEEASAEYYSYLVPLAEGRFRFETAARLLVESEYDDAVLTDRSTWPTEAVEYDRGGRVVAALDARIRNATDGRASFTDVYRALERQNEAVTLADFEHAIARYLGEARAARFVDRYVAGAANVSVPTKPYTYTLAPDSDGDGLPVARERALGASPFRADTDGDGVADPREAALGTDAAATDSDGDGLADGTEVQESLDPAAADTDGDRLTDYREVRETDSDPAAADTDGDGIDDGAEVTGGSDPTATDTDGDGVGDAREAALGTDAAAADSDGDGLADGTEVRAANSDPAAADTDGDGSPDPNDAFPGDASRVYRTPTLAAGVLGALLLVVGGVGTAAVAAARVGHRVLGVVSTGAADRLVPAVVRRRSLRRLVLLLVLGVVGVLTAGVLDAVVWPPS